MIDKVKPCILISCKNNKLILVFDVIKRTDKHSWLNYCQPGLSMIGVSQF